MLAGKGNLSIEQFKVNAFERMYLKAATDEPFRARLAQASSGATGLLKITSQPRSRLTSWARKSGQGVRQDSVDPLMTCSQGSFDLGRCWAHDSGSCRPSVAEVDGLNLCASCLSW